MVNNGGVLKLIFGGLVTVAIAATGVSFVLFPKAPLINSWGLDVNCIPTISFMDKSTNESGFRISFRPQGAKNFTLIKALPAMPGTGSSVTVNLMTPIPSGNYEYRVEAFNLYGSADDTQTVDAPSPACSNIPPLPPGEPMGFLVEPIIVRVTIVNDCDALVEYIDLNTPPQLKEDGLHIYRNVNGMNEVKIADLPPANSGVYVDAALPAEDYQYIVSAYKADTEKRSSPSVMIDIPFEKCSNNTPIPNGTSTPTNTPGPIVIITPKKLSCDWEAVQNVFLRKGPDVGVFERLTDVEAGKGFPVVGRSEDGQYWAVEVQPGVIGYITRSEKFSRIIPEASLQIAFTKLHKLIR